MWGWLKIWIAFCCYCCYCRCCRCCCCCWGWNGLKNSRNGCGQESATCEWFWITFCRESVLGYGCRWHFIVDFFRVGLVRSCPFVLNHCCWIVWIDFFIGRVFFFREVWIWNFFFVTSKIQTRPDVVDQRRDRDLFASPIEVAVEKEEVENVNEKGSKAGVYDL